MFTQSSTESMDRAARGTIRGPHVVSLIIVNAVIDVLRQQRVEHQLDPRLLAVRETLARDPSATMPREDFLRALGKTRQTIQQPDIGLTLGESLTEASLHFAGPLVASRMTLRDAMNSALELKRRVLGGPECSCTEENGIAVVGHRFERELGDGAEVEAELCVTAIYRNVVHWLGTEGRRAVTALFSYPAPSHIERYREVFGDRLRFDAPITGIEIPTALLDRPRPGADAAFAKGVEEFSKRWMNAESDNWTLRVREVFANTPRLADVSLDTLATSWGLSSRTLRRRLANENTTLSLLLEEARLARASEMLAQRRHSLPEISELLGYAEVNSFQRAFKRWAGTTPGAYRRNALRGAAASEPLRAPSGDSSNSPS